MLAFSSQHPALSGGYLPTDFTIRTDKGEEPSLACKIRLAFWSLGPAPSSSVSVPRTPAWLHSPGPVKPQSLRARPTELPFSLSG